jgi:hypothetical protein
MPATVIGDGPAEEHPMLLNPNSRFCVDLWPLVQAVPPTEGAEPELFLFDGHGPYGARMIAALVGLDHHGSITRVARDWVTTHVVAEVEVQVRRENVLADLERWLRQASGAAPLDEPEASFAAASRRAGRRTRWHRGLLVAAPLGRRARSVQLGHSAPIHRVVGAHVLHNAKPQRAELRASRVEVVAIEDTHVVAVAAAIEIPATCGVVSDRRDDLQEGTAQRPERVVQGYLSGFP